MRSTGMSPMATAREIWLYRPRGTPGTCRWQLTGRRAAAAGAPATRAGVGAEAIARALSVTRSTLRNALERVDAEEAKE